MSSQTMRPGPGSTSPSDPVLTTSGSLHADQPTTNHDQSSSRYEAGYSSGSDARGSSGWVDADGSDDGGVSGASSSGGHSGAVTSGIGGGGGSGVGLGGGVGGVGINNGIDPIRRTRKRGRSLRKNVLLRTRGVLMSNLTTNGLGIITPGMVLGSENHSSLISSSHTSSHTNHTIHALPPSPTVTHHDDDSSTSILSQKPNGVNDAVNSGYSSASPSFPSAFIDVPWAPPRNAFDPLADTVWWGWAILGMTWLVFVVGMGSILGVWEWAWDVGDHPIPMPSFLQTQIDDDADELPISGYYPALMILTIVIAWVWVIVAWVGMKYFKHAKIQPQSDDT